MLKTILLASLSLVAAATPAAAENTQAPTVSVSFADLNLTTEEGREVLDRRLHRAAIKVCGGKPDMRRLTESALFRKCLASAKQAYQPKHLAVLEAANAKRVAFLADQLELSVER